MHALLWAKNEKEILKKVVLAEAYKEVAILEANSWMANTLEELDPVLSIYLALRDAFGGSGASDYISDNNLKITSNQDSKFKSMQINYNQFYISAYGASSQCEDLKTCLKQTDSKAFNANDNTLAEDIGPIADPSEISLRKCNY